MRNFENPSVSEENLRDGERTLTDDDLDNANDPVSKLLGKSTRMADAVQEMAEKLHLDNVEAVTTVSGLEGKKARAKGFYDPKTGKITVVIPNNANVADAVQTLLHEAVAHYGLRQLFGGHFDTFLDNVFQNADEDVRRGIVDLARKHGWDFRKATEEYLASLAERTNFEEARRTSWWQKIKDFFAEMLDKIGLPGFKGAALSDNELRYILWRSYENLRSGAKGGVFAEAADIARQYELGVGKYAQGDGVLFRDGDPEMHERALARDRYEQRVRSGMYQSQEALQDSMQGLKEAMEAILKGEGKKKMYIEDVDGFENAYLGENRLSSVNKAEADAFARLLFKPLLEEVAKHARTGAERAELTDYMMAKHGLERNRVMAERDAQKAFGEYQKAHPNGAKTLQDFMDEFRQRDYAGLTALTGLEDVAAAEAEAGQMVADYENARNTAVLWEKVKAVTDAILSKQHESGMMGKETYDNISSMYEFYIPLRGFDEKTSAEAYAYLNDRHSAFNAPIKAAKGRKSKADDPFANLQSMAESAIAQGNRNKLVKQKFLNFVLNHPSDLASVSELWLQYDDVADEWRPVFPDNIEVDDTADEVERKMLDFEERMKQLAEAEPDKYKKGKDAEDIPYRVVQSKDLRQHQVVVKRGGRDYVITINGNPRAAQALNGLTNPDNNIEGAVGQALSLVGDVNRTLSSLYTTMQPDFVAGNFVRDTIYANSMAWVKESTAYAARYNLNYVKLNPAKMKILLAKYRKGTLDMNNRTERMFHQFMKNGGETGYAQMLDIEKHKKQIATVLKACNEKIPLRLIRKAIATWVGEIGRGIEMQARFAAYITSRETGRTVDRAIWDAKEISVNFNKKGAGDRFFRKEGQTALGNTAALVSGFGRAGYVFWNAAIQGTFGNFGKNVVRHPGKALALSAIIYGLGLFISSLGAAGGGDDDDDYYDLPEHVRRNNLIIKGYGKSWIKIPLPIEYRALYGLGELCGSTIFHGEPLEVHQLLSQLTQLTPIDFMAGQNMEEPEDGGFSLLRPFIPSAVKPISEVHENRSWTGTPIWKNTPYNKDMPEWTKAYKSANKYLVNLSATLNEMSGGDKYTKGDVDFNPAALEYLLRGYGGGFWTMTDQLFKLGEVMIGERDFDWRYVPLFNRVVTNGDERTEYRAVNNEYSRLKKEHDRLKTRLKHYEEDTDNGIFDYAEKLDFLYNSPEYARYEIFEDYKGDLDDLYEELEEAADDGERKEIESELNELKKEMISEMNLTRKRK